MSQRVQPVRRGENIASLRALDTSAVVGIWAPNAPGTSGAGCDVPLEGGHLMVEHTDEVFFLKSFPTKEISPHPPPFPVFCARFV